MSTTKETINITTLYGVENSLSREDFIKQYGIKPSGLNSEEADFNIKKYGINEIKQAKPKKWYNYFLESLLSPFNCILLGIVFILLYTDIYLPPDPSYSNIIIICVLVFISTFLEFFEEYRSNKAAEKLKKLVATTVDIIRNGEKISIPIENITIGDTVLLSAGSMIPADLRLIECNELHVSQSTLTGESESVKKLSESEISQEEIESITDLDTICFMGTNVISGSAKGIVIKIGNSTYLGKIAKSISNNKQKTAFQTGIENISKLLIRFMLIMIPLVFLFNVNKHDIVTSFTFAVAIAITITPLLLPVILSSSLSKGAIRMSKKKTIIKKLDSIQNFGAMNILCTDKTGTLTEDKIVLEKYLDVYGKEDLRVLKHAFLNSYMQTGLKGNIDQAVIKRAKEHDLEKILDTYKTIAEIPFDFSRRRLSVIVSDGTKKQMITKGAVEEILNICTMIDYNGTISPITNKIKENIKSISKSLNKQGFRVIAVCQKNDINEIIDFKPEDENNMILLGFIGFLDPPKESSKQAIKNLNKSGIRAIVLTGDNADVTKLICDKVGINSKKIVLGSDIDKLNDFALIRVLKNTNVFAKLSPIQKARIVRLLRTEANVVGYMGDGINDSPSLVNSDVGISVDTAVDIAKESADIILLEKDLNVLIDGAIEGRRTFSNLMKYIKLSTSFNFGEVVSVIIASIFLPFLPETPIQLLVEGLLYDFGQMTLPFDNVDKESLKKPKAINIKSLKHFMLFMGPLSSFFDIILFLYLWFVMNVKDVTSFQTIWFSYSIVSNLLGMHIIRTSKLSFIESNASPAVYISSFLLMAIGIILPFTKIGSFLGFAPITLFEILFIFSVSILYCIVATFAKKIYIKKYGEWI